MGFRAVLVLVLLILASAVQAQNFGNIPPQTVLGNSSTTAKQPAAPVPFTLFGGGAGTCTALGGDANGTCAANQVTNLSHVVNGSLANSGLANSSVTINTHPLSLGGTLTLNLSDLGMSGDATIVSGSTINVNNLSHVTNGSLPASGLAASAALSNLGYTPVNRAGDTMTGALTTTNLTVTGNNINLNAGILYADASQMIMRFPGGGGFSLQNGSGTGVFLVDSTGNLFSSSADFGTATGGALGAGKINVSSGYYVNGVPGLTTDAGNLNLGSATGVVNVNGNPVYPVSGATTNGHCAQFGAGTILVDSGIVGCGAAGGGGGSVINVGLSVPGSSIFGVTGSPITTSGTLGLTTTGANGGIPYFSSTSQMTTSAVLTSTGNTLTVGTPFTSPAPLTVNYAATAPQPSGASLWAIKETGAPSILLDSYQAANSPGAVQGRRSHGTAAAPSAVQQYDDLLLIQAYGYGATTYGVSSQIEMSALENFSNTARGGDIAFSTVTPATTALTGRFYIAQGLMALTGTGASPTGFDMGPGTINVAGGYYVNGSPLATSLGLGTLATQNANAVSITGGSALLSGPSGVFQNITAGLTANGSGFNSQQNTITANSIYQMTTPVAVTSYDALRGVAIATSGTTTTGVFGVAGYVQNQAGSAAPKGNSVALVGVGASTSNNAAVWGLNTVVTDNTSQVVSAGTGRVLWGGELDFNVTSPNTVVVGAQLTGNSLSQPAEADAFNVRPLAAFDPGPTPIHWNSAFWSQNGAAVWAFVAGAAKQNGANSNGQPIILKYLDGSAAEQQFVLQANYGSPANLGLSSTAGLANFDVTGSLYFGGPGVGSLFIGSDVILAEDASHNVFMATGLATSVIIGNATGGVNLNGAVAAPNLASSSGGKCLGYNTSTHVIYVASTTC